MRAYPPETFPIRLRGKAVSIATSANWMLAFAINYFTPPAFENLAWKTFVIFGTFNVVAGLHAFFFFPETKGRSLEGQFARSRSALAVLMMIDIDDIFASGVKPWQKSTLPKGDRLDDILKAVENGEVKQEYPIETI